MKRLFDTPFPFDQKDSPQEAFSRLNDAMEQLLKSRSANTTLLPPVAVDEVAWLDGLDLMYGMDCRRNYPTSTILFPKGKADAT